MNPLYPLALLAALTAASAHAATFKTVADIYPGSSSGVGPYIVDLGSGAMFWGSTADVPNGAPYLSDGTTSGTAKITEILGTSGSFNSFQQKFSLNGVAYFVADNGFDGTQLWRSDGTAPGTYALTTIVGGIGSSVNLTAINGVVVFYGGNLNAGFALRATDGTVAGTTVLSTTLYAPSPGVIFEDMAVFAGDAGGSGLVETDGTPAGTHFVPLPDVEYFDTGSTSSATMVAIDDLIYFVATDSAHGDELWVYDGQTQTATLLKDIFPGTTGSSPSNLVRVDDHLFFVAATSDAGRELWTSDGTAAGTVRVKDIHVGLQDSSIDRTTPFQGKLYFAANAGNGTGDELWQSDGTDAGTIPALGDFTPGANGAFAYSYDLIQVINNRLLLTLNPGVGSSAAVPYLSDGTVAGTARLSSQDIFAANGFMVANGALLAAGNLVEGQGSELVGTDAFAALGNRMCSLPEGAIPDNNATGFSNTIHLPAYGGVRALRVSVDIGHTYVGDLSVALKHQQSGRSVTLIDALSHDNDPGDCAGADLNVTLSDAAGADVQAACVDTNEVAAPGEFSSR